MKFISTLFLVLFSISLCYGQKMTDREAAGLIGSVRLVKENEEKVSPVKTQDQAMTETQYDKVGNRIRKTDYYFGDRTMYFEQDGSKVSRSEKFAEPKFLTDGTVISLGNPDAPELASKPKAPKQEKKADTRFEYRYEYQYDDRGRVVRMTEYTNRGERDEETVYVYENDSRPISDTIKEPHGTFKDSFRYDAKGLLVEQTSKFWAENGALQFTLSYTYTDYKVDTSGNWIEREESVKHADMSDKDLRVTIQRRILTYF